MHVQLLKIPDCSLPGSSVQGILQARILTHAAIFSSRGSSQPRDWTCISCVSCIGRWVLYHWATWKVQVSNYFPSNAFIYRINSSDGLNLSRIISRLVHRISRTLEIFWKLKKKFLRDVFKKRGKTEIHFIWGRRYNLFQWFLNFVYMRIGLPWWLRR